MWENRFEPVEYLKDSTPAEEAELVDILVKLPAQYGCWKTVYNRHRRWSGDGTWERILDDLRRDTDVSQGPDWAVAVDGAVVRVHQHAAGARHAPPGDIDLALLQPTTIDTGGGVE